MNAKITILWVLLAVGSYGCDFGVPGSGVSATEVRTLENFNRVRFYGSGSAFITIGAPRSFEITGDDNLLPLIETRVQDGALIIEPNQSINPVVELVVRIGIPDLRGVTLAGSADAEITGITGEEFAIDISGSGDAIAAGSTDRFSATINGAGNVKATDLQASEASISISGSGDVEVHTTDDLEVTVMGSGSVRYRGDPKITRTVFGSGSIGPIK